LPKPLEISNLSVRYPGVQALDDVSLTVDPGEFIGIIGPNGAGKSTLFSCMLGLNNDYSGTIRIFGDDIKNSRSALKKIGYVPQKMHFESNFPATVREVIRMGMWHTAVNEDKIDEVMQELWIHEIADRRIGLLSSGQQQRVFIAKALVTDPKMLILDEPITGVDQSSVKLFYGILQDLNSNHGITIVWSSHDLDAVNMTSTCVACLNRKLSFHGSTQEFFADEELIKQYSEGPMYIHMKEHNS